MFGLMHNRKHFFLAEVCDVSLCRTVVYERFSAYAIMHFMHFKHKPNLGRTFRRRGIRQNDRRRANLAQRANCIPYVHYILI